MLHVLQHANNQMQRSWNHQTRRRESQTSAGQSADVCNADIGSSPDLHDRSPMAKQAIT